MDKSNSLSPVHICQTCCHYDPFVREQLGICKVTGKEPNPKDLGRPTLGYSCDNYNPANN